MREEEGLCKNISAKNWATNQVKIKYYELNALWHINFCAKKYHEGHQAMSKLPNCSVSCSS